MDVVPPGVTENGTCAVNTSADTYFSAAGTPSNVTLTPPSDVGRSPVDAPAAVVGPRLAPWMLTISPGATVPDWKPAALYTAFGPVMGLVFSAVPVIVTVN